VLLGAFFDDLLMCELRLAAAAFPLLDHALQQGILGWVFAPLEFRK